MEITYHQYSTIVFPKASTSVNIWYELNRIQGKYVLDIKSSLLIDIHEIFIVKLANVHISITYNIYQTDEQAINSNH